MASALQPAQRFTLGAVFCATGAALVVYVLSGISLAYTAAGVLIAATSALWILRRRLSLPARAELRLRLQAGIVAGLAATLAYDASRWLLIKLTGITFWPFNIFRVFGQAILGPSNHTVVPYIGFAYHVANGVGFAVAYTIWRGDGGPLWGIAWALFLELCMVTIYPGWLGLKALDDFIQVSVFGHFIYGSVLGTVARAYLKARR